MSTAPAADLFTQLRPRTVYQVESGHAFTALGLLLSLWGTSRQTRLTARMADSSEASSLRSMVIMTLPEPAGPAACFQRRFALRDLPPYRVDRAQARRLFHRTAEGNDANLESSCDVGYRGSRRQSPVGL